MPTTTHTTARGPRLVLFWLAVLNGVSALAGAYGLASGSLSLGPTTSDRLPWGSPLVAGAALTLLVALPNGALAVVAARRSRYTGQVGIAVGAALVTWILIELVFIRELSFFHPLYVAVGLAMVWAGGRAVRLDLGVQAPLLTREIRDVAVDVSLPDGS
jgi:hypothetical protein